MNRNTPVFVKDSVRLSRKLHVNPIKYCAELAIWIGCHPNGKFVVASPTSGNFQGKL